MNVYVRTLLLIVSEGNFAHAAFKALIKAIKFSLGQKLNVGARTYEFIAHDC